eukprot:762941-Hanusia_phi.AAC.5
MVGGVPLLSSVPYIEREGGTHLRLITQLAARAGIGCRSATLRLRARAASEQEPVRSDTAR